MPRELEILAAKADAALRELRDAALADCGGPAEGAPKFSLNWHPAMDPATLAEEALQAAAEATAGSGAVRPAHVFCYECGSPDCIHSRPPEAGMVFAGYLPAGRPQWLEFFNELLALGDGRAGELFNDNPEVLARVIERGTLIAAQLSTFGRNSLNYRIWGQVVAGYLHVNNLRAALTAQIVEDAAHRLHLQVLTPLEVTDALANADDGRRSALHRIHDALAEARRQTASLDSLWHNAPNRAVRRRHEGRIFAILRHLAGSIERKGRQHSRRTVHAETRGGEQRPVHKATEDLRRAGSEDFFRDTHRNAVIVLGKSGRAHVFSPEARHVTSLVLGGDELESRQRRLRYVPLAAPELAEFRQKAGLTPGAPAPAGADSQATK